MSQNQIRATVARRFAKPANRGVIDVFSMLRRTFNES